MESRTLENGEELGSGTRLAWVRIPALSLPGCVAVGQPSPPGPQFLFCKVEIMITVTTAADAAPLLPKRFIWARCLPQQPGLETAFH